MASAKDPSSPPEQQNTLRGFPLEVRETIFVLLLADHLWNGKMPDIIRALRQDGELYYQAIGVFSCNVEFVLDEDNDWSFGNMGEGAILSIRKLKVVIRDGILRSDAFNFLKHKMQEPNYPKAAFSQASNVKEITLCFEQDKIMYPCLPLHIEQYGNPYTWIHFLMPFRDLAVEKLMVKSKGDPWPYERMSSQSKGHHWRQISRNHKRSAFAIHTNDMVKIGNTYLRSPAKLLNVYAGYDNTKPGRYTVIDMEGKAGSLLEDQVHADEWFWVGKYGCLLSLKHCTPLALLHHVETSEYVAMDDGRSRRHVLPRVPASEKWMYEFRG